MAGEPQSRDACLDLLRHYPQIREELSRAVRCPHAGADLTQETYCRALRYFKPHGAPRDTRSWLRAIARNVVRDYLRHERRNAAYTGSDELEGALECQEMPVRTALQWEIEPEVLFDAIETLRPVAKALIIGFYFERKGCRELGVEFGIARPNVKVRLWRARKKLRERLRRVEEMGHD